VVIVRNTKSVMWPEPARYSSCRSPHMYGLTCALIAPMPENLAHRTGSANTVRDGQRVADSKIESLLPVPVYRAERIARVNVTEPQGTVGDRG